MRVGTWRDIGRGFWWASAIGCGYVLATLLDQWWTTGGPTFEGALVTV